MNQTIYSCSKMPAMVVKEVLTIGIPTEETRTMRGEAIIGGTPDDNNPDNNDDNNHSGDDDTPNGDRHS